MNIRQRTIDLKRQYDGEEISIDDVLLTIVTKFQLFEPCKYLTEDEEWINVAMMSIEDEDVAQVMSIRKSEITMFGIFNRDEIEIAIPKNETEVFYQ